MSRQVSKVMQPFHVVFPSTVQVVNCGSTISGVDFVFLIDMVLQFFTAYVRRTPRGTLCGHPQVHQPVQLSDFCGFVISPSRWIRWKGHYEQKTPTWSWFNWFDSVSGQCLCMRHFARSAFSSHPRRGSKFYLYESWTPPCLRPLSESEPGDELEVRSSKIVLHYLSTLWQKLVIDDPVWALYSQQLSCTDLMACLLCYSIATHESEQRLHRNGLGGSNHHRYRGWIQVA